MPERSPGGKAKKRVRRRGGTCDIVVVVLLLLLLRCFLLFFFFFLFYLFLPTERKKVVPESKGREASSSSYILVYIKNGRISPPRWCGFLFSSRSTEKRRRSLNKQLVYLFILFYFLRKEGRRDFFLSRLKTA